MDQASAEGVKERRYDVYRKSNGDLETIKQGFSWPACIFGAIWAWSKGMVGVGFALLVLSFGLRFALVLFALGFGENAGIFLSFLFDLGVLFLIGKNGNEWRRKSMDKRGFTLVAQSVPASNRGEAIEAVSMVPSDERVFR